MHSYANFRAAAPLLAAVLLAGCATAPRAPAPDLVEINLAALNDFHGNLEPSKINYTDAAGRQHSVLAGGASAIAATLQDWRRQDRELLLVAAGDLVGASPAISAIWADETALGALNRFGLRASAVGNHEFDAGKVELLRQQKGGCVSPRPDKACQFEPAWPGASFQYLAANVVDMVTQKPFLPAYKVEQVKGVKVAFIGAVLKDTPASVLASGVAGLQFNDEAQAINRVLPELREQGVHAYVVLIHQGGRSAYPLDRPDCPDLQGDIMDIIPRLDPAIRVVVTGHSHRGYLCRVDGRLVTQAEVAGHVMTRVTLTVDAASGKVVGERASNVVLEQGKLPPDPGMEAFLATVRARSDAVLARPVARLAVAAIELDADKAIEAPLGDLLADAYLYAARGFGAQIALANRGGIRSALRTGPGNMVSLGQLRAVLPFDNSLEVMNLTGAQLAALLEEQFVGDRAAGRGLLQVSDGFRYEWDARRPEGARVVPGSVMLHGVPLEPDSSYRIVTNNFLAQGGDAFPTFLRGASRAHTHIRDTDALAAWLAKREQDGKPAGSATAAGRFRRIP